MLQQMLAEDKADMVREAVIQSLGIIMGYIDDADKYAQVRSKRESSESKNDRVVVQKSRNVSAPRTTPHSSRARLLSFLLLPSPCRASS